MIKDLKEELRLRHLKNLITEAVVLSLYEQDQMQLPASPPGAAAPPTAAEMVPPVTPENQAPPQAQVPSQQGQQITADQITLDLLVERLNIIRGGKSFTDPEVYGQMTSFVKTLADQEKQAVYKFLMQTSKVVTSNAQQPYSDQQQPAPEAAPPQPTATQQQQVAPPAPTPPTAQGVAGASAPITPTGGV